MTTSTSIYVAYGMDVSDFADIPALNNDNEFDNLRRSLGIKAEDLELRMYGNLVTGEVGNMLIEPNTVHETEIESPMYLDCGNYRATITALSLVCDKLGIQLMTGWLLYGVRG